VIWKLYAKVNCDLSTSHAFEGKICEIMHISVFIGSGMKYI